MEKVGDGEKWGNWKEVSNMAAVLAERDPWRLLTPLREACRGQHRKRVVGMLGHFPGMPLKTRAQVSLMSKGFVQGRWESAGVRSLGVAGARWAGPK